MKSSFRIFILKNVRGIEHNEQGLKLTEKALLCYGVPKSHLKNAEFCIAPGGKPFFKGLGTHFNISHSKDLWACAVGPRNCGIDVQYVRPCNFERIAGRFFSENERRLVADCGAEGFFKLWVRKEAYGKYTGEGFFGSMPEFADADGRLINEISAEAALPSAGAALSADLLKDAAPSGVLRFQEIYTGENTECVFCGDAEAELVTEEEEWNSESDIFIGQQN